MILGCSVGVSVPSKLSTYDVSQYTDLSCISCKVISISFGSEYTATYISNPIALLLELDQLLDSYNRHFEEELPTKVGS